MLYVYILTKRPKQRTNLCICLIWMCWTRATYNVTICPPRGVLMRMICLFFHCRSIPKSQVLCRCTSHQHNSPPKTDAQFLARTYMSCWTVDVEHKRSIEIQAFQSIRRIRSVHNVLHIYIAFRGECIHIFYPVSIISQRIVPMDTPKYMFFFLQYELGNLKRKYNQDECISVIIGNFNAF